jgi:cytoplasmic iron level regulating protein YaaA (DUF328/UPF0246 family)
MFLILSPSKKLESLSGNVVSEASVPRLINETKRILEEVKPLTQKQLASLMHISDALAELNYHRFRQFSFPFTPDNATPALHCFKGDVYDGLRAENFSKKELEFANKHLRILSGLYGLLKPLDLIQPYRLEMGTSLHNSKGKNLYAFWGDKIRKLLERDMGDQGKEVLINLASNEYFKAVQAKQFQGRIITPTFKEHKKGKFTTVMIFAKRSRGAMARYIIQNQLTDPEGLKAYKEDGYQFNASLSDKDNWVFTR